MKFTLVFFTVLGIYTAASQTPAPVFDAVNVKKDTVIPTLRGDVDTVLTLPVAEAQFFPNPASNKITIELKNFEPGYVQVQLADLQGNILRNEKRMVFGDNEQVVFMFSQKPGIYYVLIRLGKISLRKKLIIR